jgi:hypothetical protein
MVLAGQSRPAFASPPLIGTGIVEHKYPGEHVARPLPPSTVAPERYMVISTPTMRPDSPTMKSGASPASGSRSRRSPSAARTASRVRRSARFWFGLVIPSISSASPPFLLGTSSQSKFWR